MRFSLKATCICAGTLRYSARPSATTTGRLCASRMSSTLRSMGEWKPLMTTLFCSAISCAQRVARVSASGGAVRDAKNATKELSNNSLFPDKSIKKRRRCIYLSLIKALAAHYKNKQHKHPRWMIYSTH